LVGWCSELRLILPVQLRDVMGIYRSTYLG
jgi:hypothetical protein